MAFVSGAFIVYIFIIFCLYFGIKKEYRWIVLLTGSYLFYWINSEKLVFVIFAVTVVTFFVGKVIDTNNQKIGSYLKEHKQLSSAEKKVYKQRNKKLNKIILTGGVLVDLSMLLFFKYFNFFSGNASGLLQRIGIPVVLPALDLMIPI